MSVRKAHNAGRNHLRNVVEYYQRRSRSHALLFECSRRRNRTREGTIGHRLYHFLICRRRTGKSHATSRRRRRFPTTTWISRYEIAFDIYWQRTLMEHRNASDARDTRDAGDASSIRDAWRTASRAWYDTTIAQRSRNAFPTFPTQRYTSSRRPSERHALPSTRRLSDRHAIPTTRTISTAWSKYAHTYTWRT
jgi:U1 zinc finger